MLATDFFERSFCDGHTIEVKSKTDSGVVSATGDGLSDFGWILSARHRFVTRKRLQAPAKPAQAPKPRHFCGSALPAGVLSRTGLESSPRSAAKSALLGD
jgi:hypothetical protein